MTRKFSLIFLTVFLAINVYATSFSGPPAWYEYAGIWFKNTTKKLGVGDKAPSFRAADLEGKEISLENPPAKIRFLSFWAPWCSPCVKELPDLVQLQKRFSADQLQIITIVVFTEREELDVFLRHNPLNFTVIHDHDKSIANAYGILTTPAGFYLDSSGTILDTWVGRVEFESAQQEIEAYLRKTPFP